MMTKIPENINLYPTNDWIFKRIYGRKGSEEITRHFIKAFLNLDIKVKDLNEEKNLETDIIDEKAGILDILVEAEDGTQIDLEMQVGNYKSIGIRLTKYASKIFSNSIKKGERYNEARKTIVVMFAQDEIDDFKEIPNYKLKWNFREETYHDLILTDRLEIVIISLEKIRKLVEIGKLDSKSKIALWTKFLLNPKEIEEEDMENNKEIKEAIDIYDNVTTDMGEINAAIRREMFLSDMATLKGEAWDEGLERGREEGIKQGIKEGKIKGRKEGRKEGIEAGKIEGEKQAKIKIARKMLEANKSIEEIMEYTELTKEEIENL